MICSRDSE
uniref:Uncharacterized protein n=1 Tax=Moniliophthora roreri TaxID=221103 RepID=A0A0W0FJI0_MONRR